MTKRLLVTSDDFGMCHAVNVGIARSMREGIVRATNFLVPCPWFNEALALARELDLPVGVHLCLTNEWDRLKWGPLTRAPGLCDALGHFFSSYEPLLAQASDDELLRELLAQVERVRSLGFCPTHLDTHMFGTWASFDGVARVRNVVREVSRQTGLRYVFDTNDDDTLRFFDGELDLSGRSAGEVWAELEALPEGSYVFTGHAGEDSPELDAMCSKDHPSRAWAAEYRIADLAFFTDPSAPARLRELGFTLVSHADLDG